MHRSDSHYRILKIIRDNPEVTQRQLAEELGVSLGRTNYLVRALKEKGLIKLSNFKRSDNKIGYLYNITPKGIIEQSILAKNFLARKSEEYNKLKEEIEMLKNEL